MTKYNVNQVLVDKHGKQYKIVEIYPSYEQAKNVYKLVTSNSICTIMVSEAGLVKMLGSAPRLVQ